MAVPSPHDRPLSYGFLALGFTPLVLRYIRPAMAFDERLMKFSFWTLNGGVALMIVTSLLPIGLFQFHASATVGMWYARSEEFLQMPLLETLRWVRTFGDVVFIVGAIAVFWQVVSGLVGSSRPVSAQGVGLARRKELNRNKFPDIPAAAPAHACGDRDFRAGLRIRPIFAKRHSRRPVQLRTTGSTTPPHSGRAFGPSAFNESFIQNQFACPAP